MRRLPAAHAPRASRGPAGVQRPDDGPPDADPRIQKLVASISEERLATLVQKLAGFGTRNTLSDTTSPTRGIGAARQWIFDELTRSSPKLQVSFDTYQIARQGRITRNVELRNVVALLPGKSPRRIYVTAHYDTVNIGDAGQIGANTRAPSDTPPPDPQRRANQNYNVDAPGANDNGSGTALTMELARVFAESGLEFDATLAFVLWAGEEQGLIGSRVHATRIAKAKTLVEANFNNDIVGNSRGGDGTTDAESVRVYSEGPEDSMSRSLARYIGRVAALYVPSHRVRLDRAAGSVQPRQRPHVLYAAGIPGHRVPRIEGGFQQTACGHRHRGRRGRAVSGAERARERGQRRVARACASCTARHERERPGRRSAGSRPGTTRICDGSPRPGPRPIDSIGARPGRPTGSRRNSSATSRSSSLKGLSIDNLAFGVAAVGPDGHESLVRAYVPPPRRDARRETRAPEARAAKDRRRHPGPDVKGPLSHPCHDSLRAPRSSRPPARLPSASRSTRGA